MNQNNNKNNLASLEQYEEAKSYWFDKLSGNMESIQLQVESAYKSSERINSYKVTFTDDLTAKLLKISKNQNGSIYVMILAILKSLLYKYTDQSDLTVCSPIYNYGEETLCDNRYILFRDFLNDEMAFKELLSNIMGTVSNGYKFQYYPMEKLFRLINTDVKKIAAQSVALAMEEIHDKEMIKSIYEAEENHITILITRTENALSLNFIYKTKYFSSEDIQKFAERIQHISNQVLNNLEIKLEDVELVTSSEKNKLLNEFNSTKATYPNDKTIPQLFEEQAALRSDKVAIVFKDDKITYDELNKKANQLAGLLRKKGIQSGAIVGIIAERSIEMIISILAILKTGGTYLPIDSDYPAERITYMLNNSETKLILTQKSFMETSEKTLYNCEAVDISNSEIYTGDCSNRTLLSKSSDIAYVIYTSGSTGMPKGVMVAHTGVANLKTFFEKELKIGPDDRITQFASCSFDASVWEIFMALLIGATLYVLPKDLTGDTEKLENYINDNLITVTTLPPPYLANLNSAKISTLKKLITAGSEMSVNLYEKWKGQAEYINAYGPTETTICATIWKDDGSSTELKKVPIGRPITNTQVYILSKNNQLQPIGVPGELCIAGAGLAKGYMNRAELTDEKFTANPFVEGDKIYNTGDIARWLPNGNIEFIGRKDDQVKVRGCRVELGEIESALMACENIKEAAVLVKEMEDGDRNLCAFYTLSTPFEVNDLREYLSKKLPEYMIPANFVELEKMPVTINGKIDRKELSALSSGRKTDVPYMAPRNTYEEKIVSIWRKALNTDEIGIDDDFYELGGDSLRAIIIANKINNEFMISISSKDLLELRTIRELSTKMEQSFFDSLENDYYTVFNKDASKLMILFPPISGFGSAYETLSEYLKDYKLICFNLIEAETFIDDYVKSIVEMHGNTGHENKYVLGGYSAGGGLAFEVADRMEKAGYDVSDIILIGTTIPGSENEQAMKKEEAKMLGIGKDWVEENMPNHVQDFNKMIMEKTKRYFEYCRKPLNVGKSNSNIHFIMSSEDETFIEDSSIDRLKNSSEWEKWTNKDFTIYQGQGKHSQMISQEAAKVTANIIADILDNIYE
jgi:amino acid adenylation domain-containing protein